MSPKQLCITKDTAMKYITLLLILFNSGLMKAQDNCGNSTFIQVENTGSDAKVFRLYGGYTGLESVDDNTNPAFNYGTGFDAIAYVAAIQSDGKIICVGDFSSYNGTAAGKIVRLNTNGSIDTSFVYGTGFDDIPHRTCQIQSDGKLLITGSFTSYNGVPANRIIRLESDGSVDTSFVYGTGFNLQTSGAVIQSDGNIIISGNFTSYNGTLANRIIRLDTNGVYDSSFVYGTGFSGLVKDIRLQADEKIICVGSFITYNGTSAVRIIRLESNGSVDSSFVYGTGFTGGSPSPDICVIQTDGKVLVGGAFDFYDSTLAEGIVRLNTNGSIDGSFVYGSGFDARVSSIAIQSDGKMVMVGEFTLYNGTAANYIIRLDSDGTVDESFEYSLGFDDVATTTLIQSNGKIIVAGDFTDYNGVTSNRIVRLESNGLINDTDSEYVAIIVNGGQSSISQLNSEISSDPICISKIHIDTNDKSAYRNLLYKKERNSTGEVNSENVPLLSRYTAFQKAGVNTVIVKGSEFKTCVLDGTNYIEWVVPGNSLVTINVFYCQYNREYELKIPSITKKKYVRAAFKHYFN